MMDELVDLYLRSKQIGLYEQSSISEFKSFTRNWQSLMEQFYSQTEEPEKVEPVCNPAPNAKVLEQEIQQQKIDELEDIIKKAEEMLSKSNQVIAGENKRTDVKEDARNVRPPPKAVSKPSETKAKPMTKQGSTGSSARSSNSRLTTGTMRPSLSQSSLAASGHKAAHTNAPFKTQNLNIYGNKRPMPARPSVPTKQSIKPVESMVRSSSTSSLKIQLAEPQPPSREPQVPISYPLPQSIDSGICNEVQNDSKSVENKPGGFTPRFDYRGSQMETVKGIQNALKNNLELKRRVLTASKKPSSSRLSFLKKLQGPYEYRDCQTMVRSTSAFKVHQASVIYQRLCCLIQREMFADLASKGEDDLESESKSFQRLTELVTKLRKIDRLIRANLKSASPSENKLVVDYKDEDVSALVRRNMLTPLLVHKLCETYYDKRKDISIFTELKCQTMELDFSMRLLSFIKSTSIKDLENFFAQHLGASRDISASSKRETFAKLISSLIYFLSANNSKRTVFIDTSPHRK